jgi:hypothetical protein
LTDPAPPIDFEERVFTFDDVAWLFKKQWKKWARIAWVGGGLIFSLLVLRSPSYQIEASFKEGVEKNGGDFVLKDFLGMVGPSQQQPQAAAFMKSFRVLKPFVEKMGLQATVPRPGGWMRKLFRRIGDNLKLEMGMAIPDLDSFGFRNVHYEGETPLRFFLNFEDAHHFVLLDSDRKTVVSQGTVGQEVDFLEGRLTLVQAPEKLRTHFCYRLILDPCFEVVDGFRKKLKIDSNKTNKSIYNLTLSFRDRRQGVLCLNEVMAEYQRYLKSEHDQIAKEQLTYLEKRQEQVHEKIGEMLDEHTAYIRANLGAKGFIGLNQESESFLRPHQEMLGQLLAIDVELSRLNLADPIHLFSGKEASFSKHFQETAQLVQNLKSQRDLLQLSLQQGRFLPDAEQQFEAKREEMRDIRSQREELEQLLGKMQQGESLSSSAGHWAGPLASWAEKIGRSERPEEARDLAEYLENYSRLLLVQENVVQERLFYENGTPPEWEGIDGSTSNALFMEYNKKLDVAEAAHYHYRQLEKQVQESEFELGSLSSLLKDPLSQDLIARATGLSLKLKEEKYHSSKEGERWQEELTLQRKILSSHLEQLAKVEELNLSLIRDKMRNLQKVSLDYINRQLSVCHAQFHDAIEERKSALLQEKKILETKMQELRVQAADLPEKWRLEKWLEVKTELGEKMMESITQAVESKTIGHHLHHVESKPLDFATLPLGPNPPQLLSMSLAGALSLFFGSFMWGLMGSILKGFPATAEKLKAIKCPYLGKIGFLCDGSAVEKVEGPDLETLRHLSFFLEEASERKVVGLLQGEGPDYSYALAEHLARLSHRSILLRCDFGAPFRAEDLPGLLQLWKGEIKEWPIRKASGFDWMTAGGYSLFGVEVMQSKKFQQLIEGLKERYHWIFLVVRSPLHQAESMAALRVCDQAIVTLSEEPIELLTPFQQWAYHKPGNRLNFMTSMK